MKRAYSILNIKSIDDDERIIEGVATTPSPDRMGDIVEPLGVKFKNPLPLLWQHRSDQPVGTVKFNKPTEDGITFKATLPKIAESGPLKDRVDTAWGEVKAGLVRGVSIGFRELESSRIESGIRFIETEVMELSLVTIPANAEANIQVVKSIDAELLAASGQEQSVIEIKSAGASAKKPTRTVKAKEPIKTMKKSIAEQIREFEATRQAKAARMTEIMDASAEKGETLDEEQKQEYDGLDADIKSVDEHLVRLHKQEKMSREAAVPAAGETEKQATQTRSGVRVEGVKANLPKGVPFARYAMALARGKGNLSDSLNVAINNKTWKDQTPEVETVLRAAVAAGNTTDSTWAAPLVEYQVLTSEFIDYLRPMTIVGRIPGLRNVPFKVKVPRQTAAASVGWVGEATPKAVSKLAFDSVTLDHTTIAGIVALTEQLVRLSTPSAEQLVRDDLAKGIVQLMDNDFIDPDKSASAGVSPASITNGVTPVAATGTAYANLKADVKSIFDNFLSANISPDGTVIVMHSSQALSLSLMENALGQQQFPGLGITGGTAFGLPVIASENVPYYSTDGDTPIIFVKAPDVMLADDGSVTIDISREASLQMDSAPDNPASASTVLVSLWQHNMVGIRAERMVNWVKRRDEAVQVISGALYA